MRTSQIDQLISRIKTKDPVLYEILRGLNLDSRDSGQAIVDSTQSQNDLGAALDALTTLFNNHKNRHVSGGADAFTSTDLLEALVKRIRSATADLTFGNINNGEVLLRSGSTIISGPALLDHNHTSIPGDGGVLTGDEHDSFSNYLGIATPATPAAGNCRIYAKTGNGHTILHLVDQDGTERQFQRDNLILVRNTSGGTLTKGTVADIYAATGQVPEVRKAQADNALRHAEGVLFETIANNGFGLLMFGGVIKNLDTSAFADGTQLYLSDTPGALSSTPGTFEQGIAIVIYSHATQGQLLIYMDTMLSAGAGPAGHWEPVTNGDPAFPEVMFDGNGDILMNFVP